MLGGDVVPFGHVTLRPIVLPVQVKSDSYRILQIRDLKGQKLVETASWFEQVQKLWEEKRTAGSADNFPQFIDSINFQNLLELQNPAKKYVLIYTAGGTNLYGCVINKKELPEFQAGKTVIKPRGFLVDKWTWYFETDDEMEAYYLCSLVNAPSLNKFIKPYQTKGLFGERHIHRRPFMLPIDKFDKSNTIHVSLTKLGKQANGKITKITFTKNRASGLREEAVSVITSELNEIDKIVKKLLHF
jgi:hypothetical protein